MLGNVWRRELIMLFCASLPFFSMPKLVQGPLLVDVMQGISVFLEAIRTFRMSWFCIVILIQVVIGDSFSKLILSWLSVGRKHQSWQVSFCSVLNLFSVGGANVLLLLVLTRHHSLHFAWTAAFCLLLFLACFAFLTLIFPPVICEGLVVVIAVLTIFADGMPFLAGWCLSEERRFCPGECFGSIADADHHRLVRF